MSTILHVDMDAFFASVELLKHPEWRGKPVIVGAGPHERGVVSTCSYEARKFGVHSAMPSRTAFELCPQGIFVPPHMSDYKEVSQKVFTIFEHYTPFIEGVSIDEAFLDITGTLHLFDHDPVKLGEALRTEVHEQCGITCSVGIAPNRLLAKIGSEQHKPNGLTLMPFELSEIASFLAPKPLDILWGVGKKTTELLRPYGIVRCGDVQKLDERKLATLLGSTLLAHQLHEYSFGRDSSVVAWQPAEDQSVSREYTFDTDEDDPEAVRQQLLALVIEVGRRFRREERWARTAKIKVRDSAFHTVTRQLPFSEPARDDAAFRHAALELWAPFAKQKRFPAVRLIGFGVTDIQNHPQEDFDLFGSNKNKDRQKRERLSAVLDQLRERGLISSSTGQD